MTDPEATTSESYTHEGAALEVTKLPTPTELPSTTQAGMGLVVTALILPVISGIIVCLGTTYNVSLCISIATVVLTAALVAIDASRLGTIDLKGRRREGAAVLFLGMLAFWVFVYPIAFFRRSSFSRPNLGMISLLVAVFFSAGPFVTAMLKPVRVPTCDSQEVVQLLQQILRGTSVGATVKSIDGHRELSYDSIADVRQGECVAHLNSGDIAIKFFVEWQDRKKSMFRVRLQEPELPTCVSPEVKHVVEQVIRSTPVGAGVKTIDGHRELSYDSDEVVRYGECVVHTETADLPVSFIIEWQDKSKGLFQVRLPDTNLPTCDSKEVLEVLEDVIREAISGDLVRTVDGQRELKYDGDTDIRYCECVAHLDSTDVLVYFAIEWQDRSKGRFQVRILSSPP